MTSSDFKTDRRCCYKTYAFEHNSPTTTLLLRDTWLIPRSYFVSTIIIIIISAVVVIVVVSFFFVDEGQRLTAGQGGVYSQTASEP